MSIINRIFLAASSSLIREIESSMSNPFALQRECFENLMAHSAKTAYGKMVGIDALAKSCHSYKERLREFQSRVPIMEYDAFVPYIERMRKGERNVLWDEPTKWFAKSSGTLTVIGGAGLVVGSFVSGGTATPNFSRFAKSGKVGAITTVIAFFIGNSLMFFFGGVSSVYVGGNDIFEVMINLGLFYLAILVLGLNIWTTNDNALYSAGLGLANIFGQKKKPMVLVSGIIGTVLAVWLYWNFCGWLNILNCTLPPVGIILVLGYFLNKEKYQDVEVSETVNWFAVIGVVLGAVVANLVHWGIASINGMVVAAVCYLIGRAVEKK